MGARIGSAGFGLRLGPGHSCARREPQNGAYGSLGAGTRGRFLGHGRLSPGLSRVGWGPLYPRAPPPPVCGRFVWEWFVIG